MNIFYLFASFEAFCSLKNNLKFSMNFAFHTIFMYENYKIIILSWKKNKIFKNHQKCVGNLK